MGGLCYDLGSGLKLACRFVSRACRQCDDHECRGKKGRQLFEDGRWVGMQQEDHLRLSKHAAQVSSRKLRPSIL